MIHQLPLKVTNHQDFPRRKGRSTLRRIVEDHMVFAPMYHLHSVQKTNLVLINLCNWEKGHLTILMRLFQQSVCVLLLGKEFLVLTVLQHLDVLSCQSKLMLQVAIPVHFRMIRVLCMGDHICQIIWKLSQWEISRSIYHLIPLKFQNLKNRKK